MVCLDFLLEKRHTYVYLPQVGGIIAYKFYTEFLGPIKRREGWFQKPNRLETAESTQCSLSHVNYLRT